MTNQPDPDITKSKSLPLVWIVPIVALLVGGFMIYREFRDRGPKITITFAEGSGLEAGKTVVQYKGMAVGLVESVSLTSDMERVKAVVTLARSAKGLAREGSKFWILRPEIGFEGVSGLDTLISGPTIQVSPGVGPFTRHFEGLERAPLEGSDLGIHYVLRTDTLSSLHPGAPVLYREIKVGEVVSATLASDSTAVLVTILINAPYDKLVRSDTVFWNASGIAMKVGLLGAKIQTSSLESALAGGVMFATPERLDKSELAPESMEFELHDEVDEDWLDWKPVIELE